MSFSKKGNILLPYGCRKNEKPALGNTMIFFTNNTQKKLGSSGHTCVNNISLPVTPPSRRSLHTSTRMACLTLEQYSEKVTHSTATETTSRASTCWRNMSTKRSPWWTRSSCVVATPDRGARKGSQSVSEYPGRPLWGTSLRPGIVTKTISVCLLCYTVWNKVKQCPCFYAIPEAM